MTAEARIGVAMSGGGSRACAFSLGVLRGLFDLGILDQVRVISGISGGSVAAAAYAYHQGSFESFDATLTEELRRGFHAAMIRHVASPSFLLRRTGAAVVSASRAVAGRPARRTFNRTDALADVLRSRLFGARLLDDVSLELDVVLTATDLRTTNAFRFGSSSSACSAFGTVVEPIQIADAVAASAAFPLLLPPVGRTLTFKTSEGEERTERVSLSDGGIYDNLGTSVFETGRSAEHSQHVYDVDYLIVCDAGRGRLSPDALTGGPLRLKRAFDVTYRKSQDRSRGHLYDALAVGHYDGLVHAYLGMPDDRLPVPVADLVPVEAVREYGTNFAAMTAMNLDAISTRGEQLVRTLSAHYCPELLS